MTYRFYKAFCPSTLLVMAAIALLSCSSPDDSTGNESGKANKTPISGVWINDEADFF